MRTLGRPGIIICTLSSHIATRAIRIELLWQLYAKAGTHRAPRGSYMKRELCAALQCSFLKYRVAVPNLVL